MVTFAVLMSRVTAVVVAFGAEALLPNCVRSILASEGIDVEVVLVDNGCTDGGVEAVRALDGVHVITPGRNLGFDEACNVGVAAGTGDFIALVNFDAVVRPDALARLAAVAGDTNVGIATASLRLDDNPELMNSAGNEVHFLGYSWCGGLNEPASQHAVPRDVASASGAAMVMRRAVWDQLGGFAPEYFMYYEDPELSLRCWRAGLRVVFVPDAVVVHRYEFGRNPEKMYLVERNRLIAMFTLLERRTLALLLPVMIGVELAMLALAAQQGWGGAKVRGWWWLLRHREWVRARRAALADERVVRDAVFAPLLATRLTQGSMEVPGFLRPFDAVLALYWKGVRSALRR
jgi:GT2 family glycosyltransferase